MAKTAFLLDVNILIALVDQAHVHHELAHSWFNKEGCKGYITCAITENGFIRILCNPKYPGNRLKSPLEGINVLKTIFKCHRKHRFIEAGLSLTDPEIFVAEEILGTNQLTDIYLLGLASYYDVVFATLDARVNTAAIRNFSPETLTVLTAK